MDKELKTKWVAALRSGEYKQAKGHLKVPKADGTLGYCCLGVLGEVSGLGVWISTPGNPAFSFVSNYSDHSSQSCICIPGDVARKIGLQEVAQNTLAIMNDGRQQDDGDTAPPHSFLQIADWIEINL